VGSGGGSGDDKGNVPFTMYVALFMSKEGAPKLMMMGSSSS